MPTYHFITETSPLLHDANCIYCHVDLGLGDHVAMCNECSSPHHVDCWQENTNYCATFGCSGFGVVGVHEAVSEMVFQPQLSLSDTVVVDKYSWWANSPSTLKWSPDGKLIAYSRSDRYVRILDVANRQGVRELDCGKHVTDVTWSQDGKQIASMYNVGGWVSGRNDRVWDTETGQLVAAFEGYRSISEPKWSPDGDHLATASLEDIFIWDTMHFNEIAKFRGHRGAISSLCWSPDGQQIASAGYDCTVRLWKASSGELTEEMYDIPIPRHVSWSPDGSRLLVMAGEAMRIWPIGSEPWQLSLNGRVYNVNCAAWSPDGRYIVSGSSDRTLRIWDCLGHVPTSVLYEGAWNVLCVDWSPDGSQIAFGASDCTVRTIGLV